MCSETHDRQKAKHPGGLALFNVGEIPIFQIKSVMTDTQKPIHPCDVSDLLYEDNNR